MTYEGDNTVMAQQAFNLILKKALKTPKKPKQATQYDHIFDYLKQMDGAVHLKCHASKAADFLNLEQIEEALQVALSTKMLHIFQLKKESKSKHKDFVNSEYATEIVRAT